MSEYRAGKFSDAITAFIDLNVNPAKVVALYPESISGRLSVPQEEWIPLFGGPRKAIKSETGSPHKESTGPTGSAVADPSSPPPRPPSPVDSVRDILKTGLETIVSAVAKDDDTASVQSRKKGPPKGNSPFYSIFVFWLDIVQITSSVPLRN